MSHEFINAEKLLKVEQQHNPERPLKGTLEITATKLIITCAHGTVINLNSDGTYNIERK